MEFPQIFKRIWWVVCLVLVIFIIYFRWSSMVGESPTTIDVALLAVFFALVLMPFFAEYSFMGMSIKQKLDEVKKEIKEDIYQQSISLRGEINSAINNNLNQSVIVQNLPPPTDRALKSLEANAKSEIEKVFGDIPEGPVTEENLRTGVSESVLSALSSRINIETELKMLYEMWFREEPYQGGYPRLSISRMLRDLERVQAITPSLANSIINIFSVVNPIIHGEPASKAQIEFLNEVVPPIVNALRTLREPKG